MARRFVCLALSCLLLAAPAALAQPQPPAADPYSGEPYDSGAYSPEGYVPLPGEEDMSAAPTPLAPADGMANDNMAIPADETAMAAPETVPAADPLMACKDAGGNIEQCLADRLAESEETLEGATVAARALIAESDTADQQRLTASNMAFNTFRDAECQRQKNRMDSEDNAPQRLAMACAIILNELRTTMLRGQ